MENSVAFALLLTCLAGLSTGIGSALAFFAKRTNIGFLSLALGFSAGVMIYVSFAEILPQSNTALAGAFGVRVGEISATLSFFGGILLIAIIDRLIPSYENPHEARTIEDMHSHSNNLEKERLMRMGTLSALAIGIHNFPEGMATFFASLSDPAIGVSIAIAVAIHNIPEGIAISVPIYFATGSRKKAFWWSFLSGLAEPLGAVLGYLVLLSFWSDGLLGVILGSVAGIMVFISLDELFPAAREYGKGHLAIYGLIGGMALMAASLIMLE